MFPRERLVLRDRFCSYNKPYCVCIGLDLVKSMAWMVAMGVSLVDNVPHLLQNGKRVLDIMLAKGKTIED